LFLTGSVSLRVSGVTYLSYHMEGNVTLVNCMDESDFKLLNIQFCL